MTKLGIVKQDIEIGYTTEHNNNYIWHACEICGKERWVLCVNGRPRNLRCSSCAKLGKRNPSWKGGQTISDGYVYIRTLEHPRTDKRGYVKRAILILEEKLGRAIRDGYDCHHINEIKDDDRPENLEEKEHGKHASYHLIGNKYGEKGLGNGFTRLYC